MTASPLTRFGRAAIPKSLVRAALVVAAIAAPIVAAAQLGAGVAKATKLEPTSNSAMAIAEFNAALSNFYNVQPIAGNNHLRNALEADPGLGIARVLYGMNGVGLTTAQREQEINRGVADAVNASTPELLVAAAYRAQFRRDIPQAQALLRSAAAILPNDPNIAYHLAQLNTQVPGNRFTESIGALRTVTTRFPDYAPPYNTLAYSLWRSGDHTNALKMVETYVAKAGNEPNPHDSYAELLQWAGRFDEAIVEYKKALAIDPTFAVSATGQAEVYVLEGRFDLARAAITDALPRLTTPADRVRYQRQIATTYFLEGNAKMAISQLSTVITEGKAGNVPMVEGGSHIQMAIIDAIIGDGKSVANHLTMTGTELSAIDKAYLSGFALALAKQTVPARASLDELNRALMGKEDAGNARYAPTVNALILLNEGKAAEAVTEISRTDLATPITRAVLGLAQQQLGNVGTARSLRDEILSDRAINLDNGAQITARRLVKKIT